MRFNKLIFITFILISFILSGCNQQYVQPEDVDLIPVSQKAAKDLLANTKKPLTKDKLIVVSSFVNVDNLQNTSAFGRIVSSQISTSFFNAGYRIKSMELPTDAFVKSNNGFLQLTENARNEIRKQGASTLVAGIFAPGRVTAYVSIRMIDIDTREVISSTDFSVPMGIDTRALLRSRPTGSNVDGNE
jgi:hypothetical protein